VNLLRAAVLDVSQFTSREGQHGLLSSLDRGL
jgi:hypothetical protein